MLRHIRGTCALRQDNRNLSPPLLRKTFRAPEANQSPRLDRTQHRTAVSKRSGTERDKRQHRVGENYPESQGLGPESDFLDSIVIRVQPLGLRVDICLYDLLMGAPFIT